MFRSEGTPARRGAASSKRLRTYSTHLPKSAPRPPFPAWGYTGEQALRAALPAPPRGRTRWLWRGRQNGDVVQRHKGRECGPARVYRSARPTSTPRKPPEHSRAWAKKYRRNQSPRRRHLIAEPSAGPLGRWLPQSARRGGPQDRRAQARRGSWGASGSRLRLGVRPSVPAAAHANAGKAPPQRESKWVQAHPSLSQWRALFFADL